MGRNFCLTFCCLFISFYTLAQQETIEHPIKKGETISSIARQYEVTVQSIFDLNPGSRDVIYAGSFLTVPKPNTSTSNSSNNSSGIKTYTVVRGDTKSGLSNRFNVSIVSLEQQNPQIVDMLQAGHILKIDSSFKPTKPSVKNGERYVNKGETLWGIAKENNICVNALIAANKDRLSNVLMAGQTLRIPDKNTNFTTNGLYIVQKGDTKWGLAKRFNKSIAQLETDNPQIVDMLMAGHRIDVDGDASEFVVDNSENSEENTEGIITEEIAETDATENNSKEEESNPTEENQSETITQTDEIEEENTKTDDTSERFVDYVIQPKETLFGLSKKAGISTEEMLVLNPQLKSGVAAGATIKMPKNANTISGQVVANNKNTSVKSDSPLLSSLDRKKQIELYFYLPFSQSDFEGRDLESPEFETSEIYKNDQLDFYEGATIAMDSARALGLDFDVALLKKDKTNKIKIDKSGATNAVLVPYLTEIDYPEIVSANATTIISVDSNFPSTGGHTVYEAMPSVNKQKLKMLQYINTLNANVLIVSDLDEMRNLDLILNTLPKTKFLKVDKTGFFEDEKLEEFLDKKKPNVIIMDTDKTIVFLNATTTLMSKLSDYDIQMALLERSQIPEKGKVSEIRYRILKLVYPSPLPQSENNMRRHFTTTYEARYNKTPSEAAFIGFDTTLDVLLRLAQQNSFEDLANTIESQQLGLRFEYQKTTDRNYQNKGVYILQYGAEDGIKEID